MEIIEPSFTIEDDVDGERILASLEKYGRVCYKSEDRITPESARKFLSSAIKSGHESIIEHEKVTVRIICDRGVLAEITRHRIGSYSVESTRYVNYQSKGFQSIRPYFFMDYPYRFLLWQRAMEFAEDTYLHLIAEGAKPEEARSVLPNSLKTEIIVTYNLREWRHFFKLRCSKKAHPQMRQLTIPMLAEFKRRIPVIFDDIECDA